MGFTVYDIVFAPFGSSTCAVQSVSAATITYYNIRYIYYTSPMPVIKHLIPFNNSPRPRHACAPRQPWPCLAFSSYILDNANRGTGGIKCYHLHVPVGGGPSGVLRRRIFSAAIPQAVRYAIESNNYGCFTPMRRYYISIQ